MAALSVEEGLAQAGKQASRWWWAFIVTGVAWIIFGILILSGSPASIAGVAVLFGIAFLAGGIAELMLAAVALSWRWAHAIFGVISIAAGVVALAWPGRTFVVLASIVGFYLIFDGAFGVMMSISSRRLNDLWWLGLIIYLFEIGLGVWASGYVGRSMAILVIWVSAAALVRGFTDILLGLGLHGADRQLSRYLGDTSAA